MIKTYYLLTKPGILFGNAITTTAGFLLASKGHIDIFLFLITLIGLSGVIASACVLNNYIDRVSDGKMIRTKNRALAKGLITGQNAIVFSLVLGFAGILILGLYTNLLAVLVAATGFFVYVVLYSFSKYLTTLGTVIGSIAGAVPPVVGYTAVSNSLDLGAAIFFLILVLWQMPHFFAIALYRLDDYTAADIPVLPVKKGITVTKIQMLLYIIAFTLAASLLTFYGYTGYTYLLITLLLSITWLWMSIQGFKTENDTLWARKMFLFSLIVITGISLAIPLDVV